MQLVDRNLQHNARPRYLRRAVEAWGDVVLRMNALHPPGSNQSISQSCRYKSPQQAIMSADWPGQKLNTSLSASG